VVLASALGLIASGNEAIIAPLLATQILWINLVTDGAPRWPRPRRSRRDAAATSPAGQRCHNARDAVLPAHS
jgi:hypothetical protein